MSNYPKLSPEIIAWLRKRELEKYRQSERCALYAPEPSESAPLVSEARTRTPYVLEF